MFTLSHRGSMHLNPEHIYKGFAPPTHAVFCHFTSPLELQSLRSEREDYHAISWKTSLFSLSANQGGVLEMKNHASLPCNFKYNSVMKSSDCPTVLRVKNFRNKQHRNGILLNNCGEIRRSLRFSSN